MQNEKIIDVFKKIKYPGTDKDIYSMHMVDQIIIEGNQINIQLSIPHTDNPYKADINLSAMTEIQKVYPKAKVNIHFKGGHEFYNTVTPSTNKVKNIIAIASGKGGVGKSTIATNLALSLKDQGAKVGLVDTDLYGPSIPIMFGLQGKRPSIKEINNQPKIIPLESHGIPVMSIGFIIEPDKAMVMRGPRLAAIIKQFFNQVLWPSLDYLIVDLPPGTGDIQLSLVQSVSVTGAIIVTTPQRVAVADAIKAANMFVTAPVNVPLLGVVENMSWFTPEELPDHKYRLFGQGGGQQLARLYKTKLLGQIPMVQNIMEGGDNGKPASLEKNSITAQYFKDLATNVIDQVAIRNKNKAPTNIVNINVH